MNRETMIAARAHTGEPELRVEEIPMPTPCADELLLSVSACGVCHTDVHAAAGEMPGSPSFPFVPGHEAIGAVVEIGSDVTGFKEGDLVGVPSLHWACGVCEYCKNDLETLCHGQLATGYTVDGGFAQYVICKADFAARISSACDIYQTAPLLCAGVTTFKALKVSGARRGDWVVVSGVGGLGHVAIQYAKAMGFEVGAVDVSDEKLALAKTLGASVVFDGRSRDLIEDVHKATGGAHATLITAASAGAFRAGVDMLRRGGVSVLCGLPPGDFPLPIADVVLAGKSVKGSIIGTRRDLDESLEFALAHGVEVSIEKYPLSDVNDVFARLKNGEILGRAVLDFSL